MSIIRVEKTKGYSVIKNTILNDTRLSYRAIGIAAHLLSKPDGWHIRADYLWTNGVEGRDAVRAAMKELEECGYLVRLKTQDERGRWSTDLILREEPANSPTPGKPSVGKSGTISKYGLVNTEKTINHSGQNDTDVSLGREDDFIDDYLNEVFSQSGFHEKDYSEDVVAVEEVGSNNPTNNPFSSNPVEQKSPGREVPARRPLTLTLNVNGEVIGYSTFSPSFTNEGEGSQWRKFVDGFHNSLIDSEKKDYLQYIDCRKDLLSDAWENIRIISWVLHSYGGLMPELSENYRKYFWWKSYSEIYNLCKGDLKTLIILVDEAAECSQEKKFTLDNPRSFFAYMKANLGKIKTYQRDGAIGTLYEMILANFRD